MGTDWRDSHRAVEPIVEIYQGDRENYEAPDAPPATKARSSADNWRPLGFVNLALIEGPSPGLRVFQRPSFHAHQLLQRVRGEAHPPGDPQGDEGPARVWLDRQHRGRRALDRPEGKRISWATSLPPASPPRRTFTWRAPRRLPRFRSSKTIATSTRHRRNKRWSILPGATGSPKPGISYYYVRGEQEDGELVWVSPVWIHYGEGRTRRE